MPQLLRPSQLLQTFFIETGIPHHAQGTSHRLPCISAFSLEVPQHHPYVPRSQLSMKYPVRCLCSPRSHVFFSKPPRFRPIISLCKHIKVLDRPQVRKYNFWKISESFIRWFNRQCFNMSNRGEQCGASALSVVFWIFQLSDRNLASPPFTHAPPL